MQEAKLLFTEIDLKDQMISGNKVLFKLVEGEIAKLAIKEYENNAKMVRYLTNENDQLKYLT